MARVLLSAPANKAWATGPHLGVALRDLGHEVRLADFRSTPEPDAALLRAADEFAPEIHVMWKGDILDPDTLRALSKRGVYNVFWHSDATVPDWLPPLAKACDLSCVQAHGMLDAFREAGIERPEWLMEGVTPSCFAHGELTEAERRRYACDVVLIGTLGHRPDYRRRIHALDRLAREGFRVRWYGRRLPLRLSSLRDWLSPVGRTWRGRVAGARYAKVCHCAKSLLTLPFAPEIPGGLSNRAFMVTALGTFYLSLYREGMEEFFELGKEIVVFRDLDEMVDKARYYLAHDAERQAIAAAAGQRRTLDNYTNQHTFRRLFRLIAERGGPEV